MTEEEIKRTAQELLKRPYVMVIRGDPTDGYLAKSPELPGWFTAGETPEEALELLRDAMALWFESMLETGDSIPEPEAWSEARKAG
ncbi:MAG TPA: type II toxin-antitoxin system HicB family antitoxin [Dehalococcoidia bacterium]|nr:type II toxin-antitoxin system HicB family antitoxin [Dehalococcoidia bacterium]